MEPKQAFSAEPPPPVAAPTLPQYGIPVIDPKQARPLQKIISKMFKAPRVRANRHPRVLSSKKKKTPFY